MKLNKRRISTLSLIAILAGGVLNTIGAESVTSGDRTLFISPGEYPGKSGKRSSVANEVLLDKNKYPLYDDGTLGEYYINKPFVEKISEYVQAKDNTIKVVEYYRKGSSDDLNAMGNISKKNKGDIYLAIHTNSNPSKSKRGFLSMVSTHSTDYKNKSDELAKALAEGLKDNQNPIVPDRGNGLALNETKIGELNESMKHMPAVLLELGYFSSPEDLKVLTADKYINTISNRIANVIVDEFHSGAYDKDQSDERSVIIAKKKEDKPEEVGETIEQTEEPPKDENETTSSTVDESTEVIEGPVKDEVVEEEKEESKGMFKSIFSKEEKVSEPEKELGEMSLEEVEVEYQRAVKALEELNK